MCACGSLFVGQSVQCASGVCYVGQCTCVAGCRCVCTFDGVRGVRKSVSWQWCAVCEESVLLCMCVCVCVCVVCLCMWQKKVVIHCKFPPSPQLLLEILVGGVCTD